MRRKKLLIFLLVLVLPIVFFISIVFIWKVKVERAVSGRWQTNIDMSEQVRDAMSEWLGDSLKTDDFNIPPVKLVLDFNKDGSYSICIDEASYNACSSDAYSVSSDVLENIILDRLRGAGYESDEALGTTLVSELVQESIGMSTDEYLNEYGPLLMPDISEAQAVLNEDGTYRVDGKIIVRMPENGRGEIKNNFTIADDMLILVGTDSVEGDKLTFMKYPIVFIRCDEQ